MRTAEQNQAILQELPVAKELSTGDLFQLLVESVIDYAIFILDPQGRVATWNTGAERIKGYKPGEIVGQHFSVFYTKEAAEQGWPQRELAVAQKEGRFEGEGWRVCKDRSQFWANVVITALRDESGKLLGFATITRNLTESKRAEVSLRESEERYRALFDRSLDCVYLHDFSGNFLDVNQAGLDLIGYRREEIRTLTFASLLTDDQLQRAYQLVEEIKTTGQQKQLAEFRVRHKDGRQIYVEIQASLIFRNGQPFAIQGIARDITERKRAEATLRKSEQELRAVLDATPFPVALVDVEGDKILFWSRSALVLFGHTAPTAAEWYQHAYPDPDYRSEVIARWKPFQEQARLSGKTVNAGEYRVTCRDGSIRICELHATFLTDRLIVTFHDITGRKRAEQSQLESREQYRQLVEQAPDGVLQLDAHGKFIFVNPEFCRMLGYTREELLQRTIFDTYTEPEKDVGRQRFAEISSKKSMRFVRNMARKDGSVFVASADVIILAGDIQQAFVRDITNRIRTQEELRERARIAALGADVGVAFTSTSSTQMMLQNCTEAMVRHLDAAFARIWTFNPAQKVLELRASAGLYTHRDGPHSRVQVGKFKIGMIASEKKPYLTNDIRNSPWLSDPDWAKREGMVAFAGYPLLVEDRLIGVMAMFARQVLSENTLEALATVAGNIAIAIERKRTTILLESVLNSVPDGVITIGEQGLIRSFNKAAERFFGYDEAEVIGKNVNILMPEPSHSEHSNYVANYLRTGQAKIIGKVTEITGRRKDGKTIPLAITVNEFFTGEQHFFTGVLQDITEKKILENQLHQSQKMEAIGQLAGGVAHDFNNLLTIINGFSDMVAANLGFHPDDPNRTMLQEVTKAGERAASLTRQLLAFSRKQVLEPKVLDLNAVVTDIEKMLRRLIGEDIIMTTVLAPALRQVTVDPGQIEQIVINLAVNARDAMPTGGNLAIETANVDMDETYAVSRPEVRPGRYVMLAVSDTGCGMMPETQAHIFEPFFTTKELGKGTGLGLATVYGIVKQSGGYIYLYSEPGRGTTFKIYLPALEEKVPTGKSPHGVKLTPSGTETILLVEDEDAVRALARFVLQNFGFKVLDANHPVEAIRLCEQHPGAIDLLVTDIVMPGMGGRSLTERIGELRPGIKVLYVSGYTDDAVVRQGVLQADVAFLQKPFTPNSLGHKVREVLDQKP